MRLPAPAPRSPEGGRPRGRPADSRGSGVRLSVEADGCGSTACPTRQSREAARPGDVSLFDVLESEAELVARSEQRPAGRSGQSGGDDFVVERRHDDLDAVVDAVANARDDVLLQR